MSIDCLDSPYGPIPSKFRCSKLEDLCVGGSGVQTGPFGSQLHQEDYVPIGTPIITVEHLGENRILHQDLPMVSDEDLKRLDRYALQEGDIVFSRVGSVDRRSLTRKEETGWLFSGRCLRVRPNKDLIDPEYLSWFFGLPAFREYIRQIAVGATMPSLNTKILSEVPIYYPALPEQRAIARILGSLDDKIELNRCMNETLESIARAIFKSWFVDFDPVQAKAEGREPAGMDAETAALFPDSFEETEMGMVPKGWMVKTIGDVLDLAYGKALKEDCRMPGKIPVYGSNGQVGWHNEKIADGPGIIVGRKGNPGTVTWSQPDFFSIDTTFYVQPKSLCKSMFYLFFSLRKQNLSSLGADSAVPGLNRNLAYMSKMLVPSWMVLEAFNKHIELIYELIYVNDQQSHNIADIRDLLLLKLISGEIQVKNMKNAMIEEIG